MGDCFPVTQDGLSHGLFASVSRSRRPSWTNVSLGTVDGQSKERRQAGQRGADRERRRLPGSSTRGPSFPRFDISQ